MNRSMSGCVSGIVGVLVLVLSSFSVNARDRDFVRWRVSGIVYGESQPFTTDSYFPKPLLPGELVTMVFDVDSNSAATVTGSIASYENSISAARISGNGWSLRLSTVLGRGAVVIANDNPDYGDSMFVEATTRLVPGKTWYSVGVDLRNPGGPAPGPGPWAPFSSLTFPVVPPSLASWPNAVFYVQARRDQNGQELDGGAYFGRVTSISTSRVNRRGEKSGREDRDDG